VRTASAGQGGVPADAAGATTFRAASAPTPAGGTARRSLAREEATIDEIERRVAATVRGATIAVDDAAVRRDTELLTQSLLRLDAVEARGDEAVRRTRKAQVARALALLKRLDALRPK
jgi:hypothetical protein